MGGVLAGWLRIDDGVTYTAALEIRSDVGALTVPDVNTATGTTYYTGVYDTLFVGLAGWGDPNSCSDLEAIAAKQTLITFVDEFKVTSSTHDVRVDSVQISKSTASEIDEAVVVLTEQDLDN